MAATAYAGEERELAVGEGEDAGAVLEGGGGWADVDVVVMMAWWRHCSPTSRLLCDVFCWRCVVNRSSLAGLGDFLSRYFSSLDSSFSSSASFSPLFFSTLVLSF